MRLLNIVLIIVALIVITVILAAFILPDSSISSESIEFISRPYKENPRTLSPFPILNAILNRYETHVRPLAPRKRSAPIVRSHDYLTTTGLLTEMTDGYNSYVEMYEGDDNVYVFALRVVRNNLDNYMQNTEVEYFPLITKIALFVIPKLTLITKEIDLDLSDENLELNLCWESYLPGVPVTVSFSNDREVLGLTYRLIVSGGVKYRVRYYHSLTCNKLLTERPTSEYYNKYLNLSINEETIYNEHYDDIYLDVYSHISSVVVIKNKIIYSVTYDSYPFHMLEKDKNWKETVKPEKVRRSVNLYEFCHDLFVVELNGTEMIIGLVKKGNSLTELTENLVLYNITKNSSNFSAITQMDGYKFDHKTALYFTLADLSTPPTQGSFLITSKDNSSIFLTKNYDKTILLKYMHNNKPNWEIILLDEWINNRAVTALNNLSVIATYPKDEMNVLFYSITKNNSIGIVSYEF